MRHSTIAFFASIAVTVPAGLAPGFAQSTEPAAGPSAAQTPAPEAAAPSGAGQDTKDVRATCRESAKSEGLKGDAMRKAVSECVVKVRPDLADRERCRMDGFAKGLRKEGLRDFVKDCLKSKS